MCVRVRACVRARCLTNRKCSWYWSFHKPRFWFVWPLCELDVPIPPRLLVTQSLPVLPFYGSHAHTDPHTNKEFLWKRPVSHRVWERKQIKGKGKCACVWLCVWVWVWVWVWESEREQSRKLSFSSGKARAVPSEPLHWLGYKCDPIGHTHTWLLMRVCKVVWWEGTTNRPFQSHPVLCT